MFKQIRFYRNTRRSRLGGICAGISDFLNINVYWVRIAFLLSIVFSFGIAFWSYVILWLFLPAKPTVPIPDVPKSMVRELNKIDKLVKKSHRELDHVTADKIEDTFDALKMLVGQSESSTSSRKNLLLTWNESKSTFTEIINQLLFSTKMNNSSMFNDQLEKLNSLRRYIHQVGQNALHSEIERRVEGADVNTEEWLAWQAQMQPLIRQLKKQAGPQVLSILDKIELKMAYLMSHNAQTDESDMFDLSKFQITQISKQYLPDAINEYLKLPPDMARTQRLANNFTAEEVLAEQLIRLDHALEELSTSLFEKDAQGLLVHGRFLKDKFTSKGFKVINS